MVIHESICICAWRSGITGSDHVIMRLPVSLPAELAQIQLALDAPCANIARMRSLGIHYELLSFENNWSCLVLALIGQNTI